VTLFMETPTQSAHGLTAGRMLQHHALRATASRVDVLACLLEQGSPMSHADVVTALREAPYDRATIYRSLLSMEAIGILTRQHFGDHVWRFALSPAHHHHTHDAPVQASSEEACCASVESHRHHPHFTCVVCHSLECYPLAVDLATALGANHADLPYIEEVILRGTCKQCRTP
jgi:Fe2+ or Zn2+ uptake regulation protein